LVRYRRDQWERWQEVASDAEQWDATYDAWLAAEQARADRLRRAGLDVIWVELDVDEFTRWCQSRSIVNDQEARLRYAAEAIGNLPPPARPQ
jgi:hypothetical protein